MAYDVRLGGGGERGGVAVTNELFEAIFLSAPIGIAVLDMETRVVRSNPALQGLLGRSELEINSCKFTDLMCSSDMATVARRFEDMTKGRQNTATFEGEFRRPDASRIWGRLELSRRDCGEQSFIVVMVADISASRAEEAALRDAENRLRERIKELTALHRTAELILHRRGTWEERLQSVAALLPAAMQYPEIATGCIRYQGQTFATPGHQKTPWILNVPWTMLGGNIGEIEVAYHEVRPDSALGPFLSEELALLKSIAEMLQTSLDRDRAEEALHQANARFRLALETTGMTIWEWDVVNNMVSWPERPPFIEELPTQMMPFGTYTHLMHPEDQPYIHGRLQRAAEGLDDLRSIECRFRRADGTWRHWLGSGWIERIPPQRATRILVALIDVTERRAMEERLRQAQKVEALGQVAGGVAHDFNNILAVLFSGITLLRDDIPENESCRETLQDLLNACERGQLLTRQLLAFSRKMQFQPSAVDLTVLMAKLQPVLARVVGTSANLRLDIDSAVGTVWADPGQIEQVVMNLVVNARDALPKRGMVVVSAHVIEEHRASAYGAAPGRYAVIEVRDDGVGIPDELRNKIFEPFFTTKEIGRGTGLGLAVVADIARRWQGHVHIASKVGEGSTFSVLFPQLRVQEKLAS